MFDVFELISLGSNCSIKYSIQEINSQATFPFDWIITDDINDIISFIETDEYDHFVNFQDYNIEDIRFTNWEVSDNTQKVIRAIDKDQFKKIIDHYYMKPLYNKEQIEKELHQLINAALEQARLDDSVFSEIYKNMVCVLRKKDIQLVHDHHININWNLIKDKYHRRFKRFHNLQNSSKKTVFIRCSYDTIEQSLKLYDVLSNKYKNFYFLNIARNKHSDTDNVYEKITKNFYSYIGKLDYTQPLFLKEIIIRTLNDIRQSDFPYRAVFGLGQYCGVTRQLKRLKLRKCAFPFDWMTSSLEMIGDHIENDFCDYFDVVPVMTNDCANGNNITYVPIKYRELGFPHHDLSKPDIVDTLKQRINQLKCCLQKSEFKVLFVHETFNLDVDKLIVLVKIIKHKYPNLIFHIVAVHEYVDKYIEEEYVEKYIITKDYTCYNIHLKELRQAMFENLDQFYDSIFSNYNFDLVTQEYYEQ